MSAATQNVDPPLTDVELVPEKETIEDVNEPAPAFPCQLADIELVYKIAQSFLPGLATACVDNTTGGIFRTPGSVAADLRTEMIAYLTQRSESFVAESVILEGDDPQTNTSDNPFDIISDFVDDFASTKRNFFSRVSGWLLSEKREDKIDDFVQDMELNGFWLVDKRSTIAEALLKNVDLKNRFHCDEKFNTEEELAKHVGVCGFRSMNCNNEGCDVTFSAKNTGDHDSICPFKIIPCEQNCSEHIMRRDMDRHCITVCKMKLVACPFYAVGCQANVPNSMMDQHRNDEVQSHVLSTLISIHKEASVEDLQPRAAQVLELSSGLAEARDVRSLTRRIKNVEAKLGPLEIKPRQKDEGSPTENAEKATAEDNISSKATEEAVNKVSKEMTEAVENVPKESDETANKVAEESSEAAKPVEKESNEPSEESTEAAKPVEKESNEPAANKVSEESTEAAKSVEKESNEPSTNKVSEESIEADNPAANKVSEESDQATRDLKEEVAEAELTVIEEPAEVSTNLGKEPTNKHGEEDTEVADNVAAAESLEAADEINESANAIQNLNKELTNANEMAIEESAEGTDNPDNTESKDKPRDEQLETIENVGEERASKPVDDDDDDDDAVGKESSEKTAKINSEDPAPPTS